MSRPSPMVTPSTYGALPGSLLPSGDDAWDARLKLLTLLNTADLIASFRLDHLALPRGLLEVVCRIPALRFARQLLAYDRLVDTGGLVAGSAWIVGQFAESFTIAGAEHIPRHGPALFVANHPGLVDAPAIITGIDRADLLVIAADRPFLRTLSATARYLLLVEPETSARRSGTVRRAAAHLRSGGALLIFPAGTIEPDPATMPGALDSLASWSASVALIARLVPGCLIVPTAASGVIAGRALRHSLVRVYRETRQRNWVAATLQVLLPAYRRTPVRVRFGAPLRASDLPRDAAAAMARIAGSMAQIIGASVAEAAERQR